GAARTSCATYCRAGIQVAEDSACWCLPQSPSGDFQAFSASIRTSRRGAAFRQIRARRETRSQLSSAISRRTVLTPKVTRVNRIDIGMRLVEELRRGTTMRDVPEESLMLTGDENIVDVNFSVLWRVKPGGASDYLFNIQQPEGTVKAVAESAMREIVGRSTLQPVLTERQPIEAAVQELMQSTLNKYGSGIQITQVQLQKVDPPSQVIDSFRDVQAARADLERAQNEAQTYANKVVPEARGRAAQITQNAEAYREQTVAEAKGATSRFLKIYDEYKKAPEVTRQRMYLETMERLFGGTDKIIMDSEATGGIVPYLPLDQLMRRTQTAPQTGGGRWCIRLHRRCLHNQS